MNTHKRIITELSACEKQLDTVLFARDDEDNPYGSAIGTGAATVAGIGSAAYLRGAYSKRKGGSVLKLPGSVGEAGSTINRGFGLLGGDIKRGAVSAASSAKDIWAQILKKVRP